MGSPDRDTTLHSAVRLEGGGPGAGNDVDTRSSRDSRRNRHANAATRTHRMADAIPGAFRPPTEINTDPRAGPTTAPKLVTAVSQPRDLVRSWGRLASATYAWTTPMVPPPS